LNTSRTEDNALFSSQSQTTRLLFEIPSSTSRIFTDTQRLASNLFRHEPTDIFNTTENLWSSIQRSQTQALLSTSVFSEKFNFSEEWNSNTVADNAADVGTKTTLTWSETFSADGYQPSASVASIRASCPAGGPSGSARGATVPEPGTIGLLLSAAAALSAGVWRRWHG
jgi:hypothetical protein